MEPEPNQESKRAPCFTPEVFLRLIEEGQRLAEEFDEQSRGMRIFTPRELQRRCR